MGVDGRFSFLRFLRSAAFLPSASAEGFLLDSFGVDEALSASASFDRFGANGSLSDIGGDDRRDISPPSQHSPVEGEGFLSCAQFRSLQLRGLRLRGVGGLWRRSQRRHRCRIRQHRQTCLPAVSSGQLTGAGRFCPASRLLHPRTEFYRSWCPSHGAEVPAPLTCGDVPCTPHPGRDSTLFPGGSGWCLRRARCIRAFAWRGRCAGCRKRLLRRCCLTVCACSRSLRSHVCSSSLAAAMRSAGLMRNFLGVNGLSLPVIISTRNLTTVCPSAVSERMRWATS